MAKDKTSPPADENAPNQAEAPPAGGAAEAEEEVKPHLGFWRQPWVQNVLPFATSLALHLAFIALAWAGYKAVDKVITVVKEQIIIPDATIVEGAEVGGIPNPGLGG